MESLAKLNWQCHRGTKELDYLLLTYLQTDYPKADKQEQQDFKSLLEREDADLLRFLLDNQLPEETQLAELVKKIRRSPTVHD